MYKQFGVVWSTACQFLCLLILGISRKSCCCSYHLLHRQSECSAIHLFFSSHSSFAELFAPCLHRGTSVDSHSISLCLPLILTLLWLSEINHPSGHLIHLCHNVYRKHTKDIMVLQIIPNKELKGRRACPVLSNVKPVNWGTNSIAMMLHFTPLP